MMYDDESVIVKKCFSTNFIYPQFANRILENYHNKMNEISKLVNILYSNIDSILIDENDFNKLTELGLIDSYEFGKFKIEYIFTEFEIEGPRKWNALTIDGTKIIRPRV